MINNFAEFSKILPANFDGVFYWDFLKPCWPRNIEPCDIDAQVEIGGHFLMFETKAITGNNDPLKIIAEGPRQTIVRLIQRGTPYITYIFLMAKKPEQLGYVMVLRYLEKEWNVWFSFGKDAAINFCNAWAGFADRNLVLPLDLSEIRQLREWKKTTLPEDWLCHSLPKK